MKNEDLLHLRIYSYSTNCVHYLRPTNTRMSTNDDDLSDFRISPQRMFFEVEMRQMCQFKMLSLVDSSQQFERRELSFLNDSFLVLPASKP